jgi:hypothetical protein
MPSKKPFLLRGPFFHKIKIIKMTCKVLAVGLGLLFLSYMFPDYPNITVHVKITDSQTKKLVKNAECTLMITYETKECLPFGVEPSKEYSDTNRFKIQHREITYSLRHPPKKYVFEVKHEDYKTVIQRDSFDKCKFGLSFAIALEKK